MEKTIGLLIAVSVLMICLWGCQSEKADDDSEDSTTYESSAEEMNTYESLTEKLIHEIEGAYLEEQKLPESSTTLGMVKLADKYTEKWRQVADEYYNKIMEYDGIIQPTESHYSSDDLHTFVSNMKTNWEEYRQVQCENYVKVLQTTYGGGTIVGPLFADYKYEMQKEWALQLVVIYQSAALY